MSTSVWVHRPEFRVVCGDEGPNGFGLAVCPILGLLVLSDIHKNTLLVFALPERCSGDADLILKYIFGGPESSLFSFLAHSVGASGYLAFTAGRDTPPLLLVTDAGHHAVHVVNVASQLHVGYVCAPGSVSGPRCVASKDCLVAVSCWAHYDSGDHVVRLFEGSGAVWAPVRVLGLGCGFGNAPGQFNEPFGVRFAADGLRIVVADSRNHRVSTYLVADGSFERHLAQGLDFPIDVEECAGGWFVAWWFSCGVQFVSGEVGERPQRLIKPESNGTFRSPAALSLTSSLGLVVRQKPGGLPICVFATPDMIAMDAMSSMRVAWMGVVARCIARKVEDVT